MIITYAMGNPDHNDRRLREQFINASYGGQSIPFPKPPKVINGVEVHNLCDEGHHCPCCDHGICCWCGGAGGSDEYGGDGYSACNRRIIVSWVVYDG